MNISDISIGITTFKERRHLVKPLIQRIRKLHGDSLDIIIMVNGNNGESMDDDYRREILDVCKETTRCYPFICPEFISLSKMWNTIVIFSHTQYNFIMGDDMTYENPDTLNIICNYINTTGTEFFRINNAFSHFVVSKPILHKLGYFDERLLAFGEEDGDMVYRYIEMFKHEIENLPIIGVNNTARYDLSSPQLDTHIDNKPTVNRKIIELKYTSDQTGIRGMSPIPLRKIWEDYQQYPYEMFVMKNKHNIKTFTKILSEDED